MSDERDDDVVIRRFIPVPRERIMAAWLDPRSVAQWMQPGSVARTTVEIDRDYFFVQVSSSSFVHFPPISTSAMCSTFVELTFVKTSRTFIVAPPPCMAPSNVSLVPSQPGEFWTE